jgi:hypothetical protein
LRGLRQLTASLDFWDDPIDVYAITLRKQERLYARVTPLNGGRTTSQLWKPGTVAVDAPRALQSNRAAQATSVGNQERLAFTVPTAGRYYLEVRTDTPMRQRVLYRLAIATRATVVVAAESNKQVR